MISESERLCRCSQMSSQLVDLGSFSMFECLLAISKLSNPVPIITPSTCQNQLVDQCPSLGSTESGAEVTTLSPVLPCHAAVPTETTTTSTQNSHQHPTSNLFEVTVPSTIKQPPRWTSQVQMVHAIAAASCEHDRLASLTRAPHKVRDGLGIRWEELGKEGREEITQTIDPGTIVHKVPVIPTSALCNTPSYSKGPLYYNCLVLP